MGSRGRSDTGSRPARRTRQRGDAGDARGDPACADPATWREPRIPKTWVDELREALPVFDPATTPTTMGAIPETFRTWPGTLRSVHPLESVCAQGPRAAEITREHPLAFSEGPGSPFAKLYDLDGRILLLGVGFNRCTALHFAESLVAKRRTTTVRGSRGSSTDDASVSRYPTSPTTTIPTSR